MTASSVLGAEEAKTILSRAGRYRKAGRRLNEDALTAEWRAIETERRREERRLLAEVRERARRQEAEVVQALEGFKGVKDTPTAEAIFDLGAWLEDLVDSFSESVQQAIRAGMEAASRRIGTEEVLFDEDDPRVEQALRAVIEKTKNIDRTTQEALREEITEALAENESISDMTRRVRGVFGKARGRRAETAAQTMATGSFEAGQTTRFELAGIEIKRWLSQRDGNVRPTHQIADGQQVQTGTPFIVGGAQLRYPGDPEGPKDEVIGCRCSQLPVIQD